MAERFRKNPTALRSFIFYEWKGGKPIWEAYKNFCHSVGKETMDYNEFEFWYMRFSNGNFDVNYDRSLDPKMRSLCDMPKEIFEKIVNKLDLMDRLIIRKVSKNYQCIIDSWNPGFKKIKIAICENRASLYFDRKVVDYRNYNYYLDPRCPRRADIGKNESKVEYGNRETVVKTRNYQKLAFDDLRVVLKNPNLQLDKFEVGYYYSDKYSEEFESMLKSLNRKIHVKKVMITKYDDQKMAILHYLETGTLKEIELNIEELNSYKLNKNKMACMMDDIVKLEQCKNVGMLKLVTNAPEDSFPIESFLKCRRFNIYIRKDISKEAVLQFTKILLRSTVLEFAILKAWNDIPLDTQQLLEQLGGRAIEIPDRPYARRLQIPESDKFFEIEVQEQSICIKRTS